MLVRPTLYGEKELKLLKKPLSKISGIWKEQKKIFQRPGINNSLFIAFCVSKILFSIYFVLSQLKLRTWQVHFQEYPAFCSLEA